MEGIAQARQWPKDWVGGQVAHLNNFYREWSEPSFLELPFEMITAVFQHMAEAPVAVWILEVLVDFFAQCHVYQISQAVQIWSRADEDTRRPENPSQTFEHNMAGYRQMLYDLRKEDEIKFGDERRLGCAQIPLNRFQYSRDVIKVGAGKVRDNAMVVPQFLANERQLSSANIQDIDRMRRSQRSKSPNAVLVT